jgi:hypothetical protein
MDRQSLFSAFLRRALGNGPRGESAIYLKSKIEVQAARRVPLNNKNWVSLLTNLSDWL